MIIFYYHIIEKTNHNIKNDNIDTKKEDHNNKNKNTIPIKINTLILKKGEELDNYNFIVDDVIVIETLFCHNDGRKTYPITNDLFSAKTKDKNEGNNYNYLKENENDQKVYSYGIIPTVAIFEYTRSCVTKKEEKLNVTQRKEIINEFKTNNNTFSNRRKQ